ncbi:MAG: AEC family transporter, partial [Ruminococcus sp.]|nr:AEC family transporter [Ruminococcus sp.]
VDNMSAKLPIGVNVYSYAWNKKAQMVNVTPSMSEEERAYNIAQNEKIFEIKAKYMQIISYLCSASDTMTPNEVFEYIRAIFRDKNMSRRVVMRFSAVFSNCGFMSLPLQQAILGDEGVFYGTVFVAVFNIIVWSYGLVDMSGDRSNFNLKNIILNPGIIGAVAAASLFFLQIHLPYILLTPIQYIAGLNTPVPMLVIGFYLTRFKFKESLRDLGIYAVSAVRLLIIPLASLFIMKLLGVDGNIVTSCTIAASDPVAATTTMFAAKFDRDVDLSVGLVSSTTLLSIITMPIIIALAQTI